jgi:colanic acid biosynthesis glycosyl transferase WcaI
LTELCDDLSVEHDITIIAGPSYHAGTRPSRPWRHEQRGRVAIVRTWGTKFPKANLAGRLINLGTYYALAAMATISLARPDVIVAETDPPLLGALAALLKRRWRCRLVYSVQDLFPDIAIANGRLRSRILLDVLKRGNGIAFKHADRIVALGQDMAERIVAKGVASAKVAVMPAWADCGAIHPLASNPFRAQFGDKFVVMYSGNLGFSQQLETVLEAAEQMRDDPRVLFVLIGEGACKEQLVARTAERSLVNVMFLPYQPKESLGESLSAADLHLIPLAPGTAGCVVPSKVYAILAAGRPFVAMMEEHAEVARLAREHNVGFVVKPGNAAALAAATREALAHPDSLHQMGSRARRLALERFDRPKVTREFGDMLANVALMAD